MLTSPPPPLLNTRVDDDLLKTLKNFHAGDKAGLLRLHASYIQDSLKLLRKTFKINSTTQTEGNAVAS